MSGQFHEVSESTHWTPFLNASIHYIRENYPLPWDKVGTASNPKDTQFLPSTLSAPTLTPFVTSNPTPDSVRAGHRRACSAEHSMWDIVDG